MNTIENDGIQLFEDQKIRVAWDEQQEEWYFSVVDVVAVLTEQPTYDGARNYWKVLKKRLSDEGSQLVTECNQLKMKSPKDGKRYKTDVANTEQLLRIIQSIPSKKAEPFKAWLAMVGRDRIEETIDPEQAIDENKKVARRGGNVAGVARKALEAETGRPVITSQNAESFRQLVTDLVTDAAELLENVDNTGGNDNGK